jgi:phosphatidylglycerol lysyltransferase
MATPASDSGSADGSDLAGLPPAGPAPAREHRFLTLAKRFGPATLSVVLFVAALVALRRELASVHLREVAAEIQSQPWIRLLGALALTATSYGALTLYDVLGLAYLERRLPYRRVALASFVGYAFSNTVGHSLLVGAPARYRLYGAWGLSALDVAKLVAFATTTLWIGFLAVAGVVFVVEPLAVPAALHLPFASVRPLGLAFLALAAAFLSLALFTRRPIAVAGWEIEIPRPEIALAQVGVAATDWALAGTVLYLLLPDSLALGWPGFFALFLLSQLAGVASQIPGGLGVFETVFLLLTAPVDPAPVVGALVLYRIVYYLLPLVSALALLLAREIAERREGIFRAGRTLGRLLPAMTPPALAIGALLAGAVLLFSGATPAVPQRLDLLRDLVPLPVVELSHFAGSLAGAGLLLLARGLERRLDAAWMLAAALLAVGVVSSLLKGFDYEEAIVLGLLLAALIPARRRFYRHAALTAEPFTPGWVAAITLVLLGSIWLGLFAHKHVDYSHELWWRFALTGDAPRFLRASIGALVVVMLFAFARLLRPVPAAPPLPDRDEIDRAAGLASAARDTYAYLAILGDKHLLWHRDRAAYLMYAVEGRSWIAMGDPVGGEDERRDLAWEFRELVDRHDGWPVFYQVRPANLHLYLDLGLALLKMGEEARVPLADFALDGSERKWLRHIDRKLDKEGCTVEIAGAGRVPALLDELRFVSDLWLESRNAKEKGFSLGFFSADYLARCPVALVRASGRLVAFANLWLGGGRHELSLDLMRHLPTAPPGVMDYLFVKLALWGRQEGYSWLNLGMAPLAGLEDRRLAPLWNRVGALAFRHGEHFYNFQGLRQYKEKFTPVWEPRYLASPGGLALPRVVANLAALIGGGLRGVLAK